MTYAQIVLDFNNLTVGENFLLTLGGTGVPQLFEVVASGATGFQVNASSNGTVAAQNFQAMMNAQYDLVNDYTLLRSGNRVTLTALKLGNQWNFGTLTLTVPSGSTDITVFSQTDNVGTVMDATATITNVTCFGADNGQIALSVTDSAGTLTVAWTKQGDASFSGSGTTITDLPPGTYDADITDGVGNNIVKTGYVVTQPTEIVITEDSSSNPTGPGVADGAIAVSVIGGTGAYSYAWTRDGDFTFNRTTQDITGLLGGTYRLTVTDANSCTKVFIKTLVEPGAFQVAAELQDNDLILTVNGGTAPYTYLWSNGATTKDLTNILPGTYTVTVTDNNGFTTEGTFVVNEFKTWLTKNPIYLALAAEDPGTKQNLSFICKVYVEENYPSGVYSKKADLEQPADTSGETVFRVERIIDAYVSSQLPSYNQATISRADNVFKRFYLEFLEKFGDPPAESTVKQVTVSYCLLGGLSPIEYAANTFFSSYLGSQQPFLTWQPNNKKVFSDQHEYLYYLVNSFDVTELNLNIRVRLVGGNSSSKILETRSNINRYEVYIFPAGYSQLDVPNQTSFTEEIESWELWLTDQDGNRISEFRYYSLEQDYFPFRIDLLYLNSLGGFDTLACKGKSVKRLQTEQQSVEKILPYDYATTDFEREILNKTGQETIDFSTGYISKAYAERLKDFLISEEIYMLANNRYIRVELETGRFEIDDEDDTLHSLQGTLKPFELKNYTPDL